MIEKELTLRCGAVLRNRIVKSAMSEALADERNNPSDALINLFRRWGGGGAAILITGNVQTDRMHLEYAANVVLDEKTDIARMKALAAAGKDGGAKIIAQLSHAGRQTPAAIHPRPVSISETPLALSGYGAPRKADEKMLREIVGKFARAVSLAREAGFDGAEIHAAHGYLLSSSLSPKINDRKDRWGGSLENRARLLRAVLRAARQESGESFIVAVKLNSSDFQKGGFDGEDAASVAGMLREDGADFLEVSGGNFESPAAYRHAPGKCSREAYFLEYAKDIKAAAKMPVMVTGGFRSAATMREAIAGGKTDLIGAGRPFIIDPSFPAKILRGETESAPAIERDFPPPDSLPRGAGLNWFCHQLTLLAETGSADLSLPVEDGHARYLAQMESATERRRAAAVRPSPIPIPANA